MPEPVTWTPQTAGWYLLAFVLVVSLVALGIHLYRRRRANSYRREALAELDGIETALDNPESRSGALGQLVVLVKRTALMALPRSEIASLTGNAWLAELDRSYGETGFTIGPGRVLPDLAYDTDARRSLDQSEERSLVGLIRQWIGRHQQRGKGKFD